MLGGGGACREGKGLSQGGGACWEGEGLVGRGKGLSQGGGACWEGKKRSVEKERHLLGGRGAC